MSVSDELLEAIGSEAGAGLTAGGLAELIGRPAPSVRRTLAQLERLGLVGREPTAGQRGGSYYSYTRVPPVVGLDVDTAQDVLEEVGLVARTLREVTDEFPEDEVIDQDPGAGATVRLGWRPVKLVVAVAPDKVKPPQRPPSPLKGGAFRAEGADAWNAWEAFAGLWSGSTIRHRTPFLVASTTDGERVVPVQVADADEFATWLETEGVDSADAVVLVVSGVW